MSHVRRGSTTGGTWPNAVLENFYERPSNDPEALEAWCYTDRLSYAPGETLRLHVSTTAPTFDLTIVRDGREAVTVLGEAGLPGAFHPTPEDCSVKGCGWPVAFALTVPEDWRSGGYLAEVRVRGADGATFAHDHVFMVRGGREPAPILLVAATGTWTAYNEWGGSNHYEGITGPGRNLYSPVLSL
ncbi:MAG: N,N-dimethylformamidase beta subunit family domain-containing protein, partial [Kiloniellales bacterium]